MAISGVRNLLSATRIPYVAALPTFDAADKGVILGLNSTGLLYFNDGVEWRKIGHLGRTSVAVVEEADSAYGGIRLPGAALVDPPVGVDVQVAGKASYSASRVSLGWNDPAIGGVGAQPHLGDCQFSGVFPNAGNVIGTMGFPGTKTGTWVSGSAPATTNARTKVLRQTIPTASTAGSSVGIHYALNAVRLFNSATGNGGFFFRATFGFNAYTAASRFFVGLRSSTALIANVEPSTLTNIIGYGANTTSTTIRRYVADGTARTPVDEGWTIGTTELYQVTIASMVDNVVEMSLARWSDGLELVSSETVNLPAVTTFMAPVMWINNGANAAVSSMDLNRLWCEWRNAG